MELLRLHYKDKKVFPGVQKVRHKLKEQFRVLKKDRHASYSESQQVCGMNTTEAGIVAADRWLLRQAKWSLHWARPWYTPIH
jgi:hypothetical protein